jgi:hypothetical protein
MSRVMTPSSHAKLGGMLSLPPVLVRSFAVLTAVTQMRRHLNVESGLISRASKV